MSGRKMKYPYSLAAKITRFPFEYYLFTTKRGWVFRYWVISSIVCLPVFYKIQQLSYAPANVEKWKELDRKQFSAEAHH